MKSFILYFTSLVLSFPVKAPSYTYTFLIKTGSRKQLKMIADKVYCSKRFLFFARSSYFLYLFYTTNSSYERNIKYK